MPRVEDQRLLTGAGRFLEDLCLEHVAHAVMVRAPLPHARVTGMDVSDAASTPGVLRVLTAEDVATLGALEPRAKVRSRDGSPMRYPPRPLLAADTVRYAGETVAVVVAESEVAARDAAERVVVDYEPLPACTDVRAARERCFDWELGDTVAVDAAFAGAARVVALEAGNNRVSVSPLETRGAVGVYEGTAAGGCYTLFTQSQGVHLLCDVFAEHVLGVPPERLRVVTGDVGGSFGMKIFAYPEQGLVLLAARLLGRPVRWVGERGDAFMTDNHARDHWSRAEVALDGDGRFLAFRVHVRANLGAYLSTAAAMVPTDGLARIFGGVYDVQPLHLRVEGMLTNTTPVDAYRGAGKPELNTLIERLVDRAAAASGIDPVAIRRRNLIPAQAMPYRTGVGKVWDSGDFPAVLERALAESDWDGFAAREAASRRRGRCRGIGLAMLLHASGGSPAETAQVALCADGVIEVRTGTQSSGQGHETVFARVVAEGLEVAVERVRVVQGDTAVLGTGGGTGGSSSLTIAVPTIHRAARAFLEQARERAATRLEASAVDLEYGKGCFRVAGTDLAVGLFDLAVPPAAPAGAGGGACVGEATFEGEVMSCPNGAHVAEVEVDPETGVVGLERFTMVDDLGRVLDEQLATGQLHGGVAQAIGQALMEQVVYDPDSGQLLTGSFMDYALPRAADLPSFVSVRADVPGTNNPFGYKGAGELATAGGAPAVMNALAHAIGHDRLEMPATPLAVWRALRGGGGG
jgi:carbon-monoxide dehydrogenase large subunit